MALALPKVCSMGGSQTGLVGTIGVALLNPDGTVHTARATANIYEVGGGCYGKNISFPDNWTGILKWDTGGGSPVYAVEEYTVDGLVDAVTEDLDDIKGTGFVKDTDSLVDIRPETDKIQTGIIDVPGNFKADVSNLDVAVSTRNATTPPTVDQIATAIFAKTVEGTLTFEQMQKILKAFIGGKTSGGGTANVKFRDDVDSKNRIVMTVDNSGNRSAVILDGT